jgi:DNA-binding winged helix-turn-helix (wHTH) protein
MAAFAFGPYLFSEAELLLRCHGRPVPLQPRTAQVLAYLIRCAQRLVTKEELLDGLWPDGYIVEGNLTQQIFLLRQLFAHHTPERTFVVTEPRRGYRFVPMVREVLDVRSEHGPAWDLYVRGRFFADQRRRAPLEEALRAFQEAVNVDPKFAPAHAGIADCHALLAEYLYADPQAAFERAREAATLALDLDKSLAEAHAVLGEVAFFRDWDDQSALEHYERATWLDPAATGARIYKAWFFAVCGRPQNAEAELEIAARAEPYSLKVLTTWGALRIFARDFAFAEQRCRDVLEMDSSYALARYYLAATLAYSGRAEAALEELALRPEPEYEQQSVAMYGYAAARAGLTSIAEDALHRLRAGDAWPYVSAFNVAQVLVGLGRLDEAKCCLARGTRERDPWMVFARAHPVFDGVR